MLRFSLEAHYPQMQGGGKLPHSTKAHRALVTDRPDRLSHRCAAFLLRGGERQ
jgi:hypothetical protein